MAEYIEKWSVVNRLIEIENEFQQYKPFHGFEHAMYRKVCEAEIAIGKTQAVDAVEVVRRQDCKYYEIHKPKVLENCERNGYIIPMKPDDFCSYGEQKGGDGNG